MPVSRGGRIAGVNRGSAGEVAGTTAANGGPWRSGLIDPGATLVQLPDTTGTLAYHCEPHPLMTAAVAVE